MTPPQEGPVVPSSEVSAPPMSSVGLDSRFAEQKTHLSSTWGFPGVFMCLFILSEEASKDLSRRVFVTSRDGRSRRRATRCTSSRGASPPQHWRSRWWSPAIRASLPKSKAISMRHWWRPLLQGRQETPGACLTWLFRYAPLSHRNNTIQYVYNGLT